MKLFLIGLPGSGKTTLGAALAKVLGHPFIDLDAVIEAHFGVGIPTVFATQGEAAFRQAEADLLRQQAQQHPRFVMATGGGAPCFHEGMATMNSLGTTLYLDVSFTEIARRMAEAAGPNNRPLVNTAGSQQPLHQQLQQKFGYRLPIYQQATHTITHDNIQLSQVLTYVNTL